MKISEYQKIYLFKPGTHYKCRRCKSEREVIGDTYVCLEDEMKDIAVDGSEARYVVWRCRLCGGLQNRGWNKPVDFTYGQGQEEYVEPQDVDFSKHYEMQKNQKELESKMRREGRLLTPPER